MPSSPASTSRRILTALAIILVITAFILVGLNAMNVDRSFGSMLSRKASQEELNESYKAGYLAARAKFPAPDDIADDFSLTGLVLSIDGNSMVVRATSLDTDPIIDGISDERTILVSGSTTVRKATEKDPVVLSQQLEANPETDSVVYSTIKLQDITVGARVRVRSSVSIRLLETVNALEVTLLP